jgi:LmbE family N-acetylglucosaminyl deacetylase
LMVLAHPDDETIGASSRLTRIETAGFIYATDGAPRDGRDAQAAGCSTWVKYARLRRAEAWHALAHAGISSEHAVFLDYPDQQATLRLVPLTADLRRWILATCPEVVLTHPYEGGHPDHDAVAFAVHAAVAALSREGRASPVVIEFASYHASGDSWIFSEFLPAPNAVKRVIRLTPEGQALKQRLLAGYHSQAERLKSVPLEQECFRLAPTYDFTHPPHDGPILYERYSWGMTVREWCALATVATERLHNGQTAGA